MASYIEADEDTSQPFLLFAHVLTMVCPCAVDRFKPPVFIRRLSLYRGLRSFWLYTHHVSTKDKSLKLFYSLWSPHEGINFGACINFSYPTHDPREKICFVLHLKDGAKENICWLTVHGIWSLYTCISLGNTTVWAAKYKLLNLFSLCHRITVLFFGSFPRTKVFQSVRFSLVYKAFPVLI